MAHGIFEFKGSLKFNVSKRFNMMNKRTYFFLSICLLMIFAQSVTAMKNNFSTVPRTNNGQKWRIGYYEGGEYSDYQENLKAVVREFVELGWIENAPAVPQSVQQTFQLWEWLATTTKSDYVHFVKDAHYNAGWDVTLRKRITEKIIHRLNKRKDIDLMIAMGTWAGRDLANNRHGIPLVVMSASDARRSGIVKSDEYSGYEHVFARVDPYRFERQIRIFHDIVGFRRLGVAYENSVVGKSYAAIDKIEEVAKERGFEIVRCFTLSDIPNQKYAEETVKKCFRELAKKTEAIYVTVQGGINLNSLAELVKIANANRIPMFSQSGSKEVEHGVLFSDSPRSFDLVGGYYADVIAKVFNGAKPGQLNQVFKDPPHLSVNLKTAGIIGFYLKTDFLSAADSIYHEIKTVD